ncbi:MAG: polyphosphate polymerase domain-containing protein [Clostridiales bacterium]|nr:polyphosphate polymerase domain-containing protein [Clostridiales bacterium]
MNYKGHRLRHEYKYYINSLVYHELRERFRYILNRDPNMKDEEGYLISSIYFDDFHDSAVVDKMDGTRYRKKYRIRLYDYDESFIKLECKSKYNNFISKLWAPLTRAEYNSILQGDYEFLLYREEDVCKMLYADYVTKRIRPVTTVEYQREAYVHQLGNTRITFDKNIGASIGTVDIFHPDYETICVPLDGDMVLEIKYDDYIPDYIWKLFQSDGMVNCAISKYVMCRDLNRKVRKQ